MQQPQGVDGDHLHKLAAWRKQFGKGPLPFQQVGLPPVLTHPDEIDAMNAFNDLHDSRQVGMDLSPIPPSEVVAWSRMDERERHLWRLVHLLDREWYRLKK